MYLQIKWCYCCYITHISHKKISLSLGLPFLIKAAIIKKVVKWQANHCWEILTIKNSIFWHRSLFWRMKYMCLCISDQDPFILLLLHKQSHINPFSCCLAWLCRFCEEVVLFALCSNSLLCGTINRILNNVSASFL